MNIKDVFAQLFIPIFPTMEWMWETTLSGFRVTNLCHNADLRRATDAKSSVKIVWIVRQRGNMITIRVHSFPIRAKQLMDTIIK
jgi:hypothetical protein